MGKTAITMKTRDYKMRIVACDQAADYAYEQLYLSNPAVADDEGGLKLLAFDIAWALSRYGVSRYALMKQVTCKALIELAG